MSEYQSSGKLIIIDVITSFFNDCKYHLWNADQGEEYLRLVTIHAAKVAFIHILTFKNSNPIPHMKCGTTKLKGKTKQDVR